MMWWGGEGGEMGQSVSVTPGAYHPEIQISENPQKLYILVARRANVDFKFWPAKKVYCLNQRYHISS